MSDATRDWDYLTVGNIVPAPELTAYDAACALCRRAMRVDYRGALYTGPTNPAAVCDACGIQQTPQLMALVHRLRAGGDVTITIGGGGLDEGAKALCCPLCDLEQDETASGWHLVDSTFGRPVCSICASTLSEDIQDLLSALVSHQRHIDVGFRQEPISDARVQQ